ncbi:cupin [Saxibacter everestensis]|uniref:Cupin n=1 Tax=Saxibacter everestensis TaxID=2909229 RepID=A0ABY8QQU7_9MICO|nr:cupin [Brevibacteriaceae bacterium ZFBP1038]
MQNLDQLVVEHLELAARDHHGRSAHLLIHDRNLRQAIIAMTQGTTLAEHDTPPAASLQVLKGAVRLNYGSGYVDAEAGQLLRLPEQRHSVDALEDSAILLTAVTSID